MSRHVVVAALLGLAATAARAEEGSRPPVEFGGSVGVHAAHYSILGVTETDPGFSLHLEPRMRLSGDWSLLAFGDAGLDLMQGDGNKGLTFNAGLGAHLAVHRDIAVAAGLGASLLHLSGGDGFTDNLGGLVVFVRGDIVVAAPLRLGILAAVQYYPRDPSITTLSAGVTIGL